MTRSLIIGLVLTSAFLLCSVNTPAGEPRKPTSEEKPKIGPDDDAKTVARKAIQALGGEKAVTRWKCGRVRYVQDVAGLPGGKTAFTIEDTFQYPEFSRRVVEGKIGEEKRTAIYVIDGDKMWVKDRSSPTEELTNPGPERSLHPFALYAELSPLLEPDVRLKRIPGPKINDRETVGLRADFDETESGEFFFDPRNALPVRTRRVLRDPAEETPIVLSADLGDFKPIGGMPFPMSIQGKQGDRVVLNVKILELKFAKSFPKKLFAKP